MILIIYNINFFILLIKQENKNEKSTETCAFVLVQKLISVLESIERLPVYLYESPGAFHGLQVKIIICLVFKICDLLKYHFFRYCQDV